MKKKNNNAENSSKEESKSLDDCIQLYTQIVRELSENLKEKSEIIQEALNNKTDLNKTLDYRRRFEHIKSHKKLF